MKKRYLAWFLTAVLLTGLFASCARSSTPAAEPEPAAAGEAPAPEPTPEPAAEPALPEPAAEPAQTEAPEAAPDAPEETPQAALEAEAMPFTLELAMDLPNPYTLPLAQELTTYSIYCSSAPDFIKPFLGEGQSYTTAACNLFTGQKTNVQLEYLEINAFSYTEQFNLMLASGNYTDLFTSLGTYTETEAYADEVILDVTRDVEEAMPVHKAVVEAAGLTVDQYNDDGQILKVAGVSKGLPQVRGLTIRGDWLDAQGLEVPRTYSQVHDTALALMEAYGLDYGIFLNSSLNPCIGFSAGYDLPAFDINTSGSHVYIRDGRYHSCYAEDSFRDYLTMVRDWISEGVIDPDFYSKDSMTGKDLFLADTFAIYWDNADYITENNARTDTAPGFHAVPAPVTLRQEGQTLHFSTGQNLSLGGGVYLTTLCEEIPLLLQFLDWMFTKDGILVSNYGIQATDPAADDGSYYYDDAGQLQWSDYVVRNPQGYPFLMATSGFVSKTLPSVTDSGVSNSAIYDEEGLAALKLWTEGFDSDGAYDFFHTLYSTDEEMETYNHYVNDVETYAVEHILKFVTGQASIEDDWDGYVDTLYAMGLQEALDAKQAALDRYLARHPEA